MRRSLGLWLSFCLAVPTVTLGKNGPRNREAEFTALFVKQMSGVKTAEHFVRSALRNYKSGEIDYAVEAVKKSETKNAPRMMAMGNAVVFNFGKDSMTIDVIDGKNGRFRFEGRDVKRKFGADLKEDMAFVESLFNDNKSAGFYDLLVPRAEAIAIPLLPIVVLAAVGLGAWAFAHDWDGASATENAKALEKKIQESNLIGLRITCGDETTPFVVETQHLINKKNYLDKPCTLVQRRYGFNTVDGVNLGKCEPYKLANFTGTERADVDSPRSKDTSLSANQAAANREIFSTVCQCCSTEGCADAVNNNGDFRLRDSAAPLSCATAGPAATATK